jgi:uncharacterized protein YjbJ (UPF0337 family)
LPRKLPEWAAFGLASQLKRLRRIFRKTELEMKTDTKLKMQGSWNEVKGKLKQKYASLTEDDLLYEEGREDELMGRLQSKLGKSIDDIKSEISEL